MLLQLEEFRRKKAEEKAAAERAAAEASTAVPPPPPAATEIKPQAPVISEVFVPLEDPQTTNTFTTETEAPSWPSPTPGGASAAAAAAAASSRTSSAAGTTTTDSIYSSTTAAAASEVPHTNYPILPQNRHQPELQEEKKQQLELPEPAPAPTSQAMPPNEVSSFSTYTNLLADPPLPPPQQQQEASFSVLPDHQDQGYSYQQPLYEFAATDGAASSNGGGVHHHSSFLSSMDISTTNSIINNPSFLESNPNNNNNNNSKEELTFGNTAVQLSSPQYSPPRSARSTSPTPSSRTTTTASEHVSGSNMTSKNDASISLTRPTKDFKELQQHIGELTEEKFTLQRCLEQQTALADRLAAENEELTIRVNASGRAVEEARHEVDVRRREVAVARAEIATAMAERDAYEMGAREASERAKSLAIEVVGLEEKMLKMKSEHLRMISEKEKEKEKAGKAVAGGGDANDTSASVAAAAAIMAAERKIEMVSSQLHAANKQIEEMKKEREEAQEQLARVGTEVEMLRRAREEDAAALAAVEEKNRSLQYEIQEFQQQHVEDHSQRKEIEASTTAEKGQRPTSSAQRENQQHQQAKRVKEPLQPPASALIAGEAMLEAESLSKQQEVREEEDAEVPAVPAEIRALLPPAVWTPGAQGLDPSVNDLVERIYEVVGLLESEKSETAAALTAQKQMNIALQARLEALLASQELALSEQQVAAQ
jgi:hypothetical protein